MASFDYNSITSVGVTQVSIPVGATNSVLVEPVAGQVSVLIKQISGSSLSIFGAPYGTTATAAQMVTLGALALPISGLTSDLLQLSGPARFYLQAQGNTAVVAALLIGKSSGN